MFQRPPAAAPGEKNLTVMLWLVATGFFMQTLDATIVNTALPSMAASLGESPLRMQSVVIAYSLTMAVMIPVSGWLADTLGTRRVFFSAILVFSLGSLLCANAHTLPQLVAFRVVQGIGGAMLLPVGRLAVLRTFPAERYLPALSFVAIPGLIGPLIGPTLGGWLVKVASWHWIFLINVPVGVAGCIATWYSMPDARNPAVGRFDLKGYLLLTIGMVAISLSLDGLADLGMQHAAVLVLLILSLACFVAYGLYAVRAPQPIFSLELFRIHTFSVGLLGNLFARIGSGAMPYLIPLLLQVSLGYTAFEAGLMMLPVAAAGMSSKRLITRLIMKHGYRNVLLANTVMVGVMMASFALMHDSMPVWLKVAQLALFGGFNSMQFTAMNTLTLKDLGTGGASSGNSLFSLVQMLSMSLGVTVAGALLATFTGMLRTVTPSNTLPAFHATFICVGVITAGSAWIFAQLAPEIRGAAREADPSERA
ncbi:EmrB/QacA subfamily drug resistance transporter [Burkholderia ubonensis]|uniref:EmrB/QacA subfamily drug resistance transporter n=1 Tax=Burkholderia ubonensis TaxID=101571 RepID=A0AB34W4V7_9BURK|nr:multidrug transporter subunit MdtD [Burkholderia ubonensis]KVK76539.1 EmrB/QacA subfamily drug resistance transporter [Burkholderia ubonensis]KVL80568.1 EmrB/QacA subfamily drug resistance transporter [Burkholderia ubonensis]KVM22347.1 EmrB/QacA subfamily drug resistance transporter [Burkholderia ubonensis]KVM43864.1 EmrB/QacA subfamily drug resistance transporter [Burkholderia ubonensis]KVN85923.1 EmrB/QacA subfamily drug resistance transporter [Burkholderia ubonensis]